VTRALGWIVQLWGWLALVLVSAVLAGGLGALVATAVPDLSGLSQSLPLLVDAAAPTAVALLGAVVLAVPLALTTAVALDQVLPTGPLRDALELGVSAMDGVPALVAGVVAALLAPALGPAVVVVALALAITPSLTVAAQDVLSRAEPEERLAAQALGATPLQVLLFVVGPAASRGLIASLLRALARLLGLAAPLLVLQPDAALPVAWQVVHHAVDGQLAAAALLALAVLLIATGLRATAMLLDRPTQWRLP